MVLYFVIFFYFLPNPAKLTLSRIERANVKAVREEIWDWARWSLIRMGEKHNGTTEGEEI